MELETPRVAQETAEEAGLRYVTDAAPGIRRVARRGAFAYVGLDGQPVDAATRARIAALVIPPAWTDVWVCPHPRGHLQATGRDAKGRKQYRYHTKWQAARSEVKYGRMRAFGEALPGLRARVEVDLRKQGLPREKVLALAVRLLDETLVRIGNAEYATKNNSFGLTTLRDKHVQSDGAELQLSFVGKSGVEHALAVRDRRLARLVKRCRDLPGQTLFQYLDASGARQPIDSALVNGYLRAVAGDDFTAKDFRTWGGTVLAAERLGPLAPPADEKEAARIVTDTIKAVAHALGNTVAVCRSHYVHPAVLDGWADGRLGRQFARKGRPPARLSRAEAAVLRLLRA